ncbi:acyl carrier protein [Serratia marcescens]|uniref:acyl carrier protein n=1 Tax=Serratia marcescens TaxID=615 RepID=UPI003D17DB49|nr:acyl carrier protein [Salmonella enterica]
MQDPIFVQVRALISAYIEVAEDELDMSADLDLVYDMDSTEMTEFAKEVERTFGIPASKSERGSWESGQAIYAFILAKQTNHSVCA